MCMYIGAHGHTKTCAHAGTHVYTCARARVCAYTQEHTDTQTHVPTQAHTRVHMCTSTHVCIYTGAHEYTNTCPRRHTRVYTCARAHVCIYTGAHEYTNTCTHAGTHACTHVHEHTCVRTRQTHVCTWLMDTPRFPEQSGGPGSLSGWSQRAARMCCESQGCGKQTRGKWELGPVSPVRIWSARAQGRKAGAHGGLAGRVWLVAAPPPLDSAPAESCQICCFSTTKYLPPSRPGGWEGPVGLGAQRGYPGRSNSRYYGNTQWHSFHMLAR